MGQSRELDPGASMLAFWGAELRRAREAAGLSQDELGRKINFSGGLVGKIEKAERAPSLIFARRCDEALGTGGLLARFWELVKKAGVSTWLGQLVDEEQRAIKISKWDQSFVPGLLQTEDYARAAIRAGRPREAAERIERRVAARLDRQAILARANAPHLWSVIDEAVLRRPVGGVPTMRAQLDRLIEAADSPGAVLQVLPLAVTEHPGADGPLTILEFADGPPAAYAEGWRSGRLIESADEVAEAVMVYDLIRAAALSRGASLDLMRAVRDGL